MKKHELPKEFLEQLNKITSKRPKTVILHILKHGFITTEELDKKYGYHHPPRAARDVREQGIPLETFTVEDSNGRKIAAYRFGDLSKVVYDRLGGRKIFSKEFKTRMYGDASRCTVCSEKYEERYLQVDHRVPYHVVGDAIAGERNPNDYMLLCGSCNRAKSWSCEHCPNWNEVKAKDICASCYWARPEKYKHVATRLIRRMDIVWSEAEVETFDALQERAKKLQQSPPEFVKRIINEKISNDS